MTLIGLLSAGAAGWAEAKEPPKPVPLETLKGGAPASEAGLQVPAPEAPPSADCDDAGCRNDEGLLFRVRTRGEEQPVVEGSDAAALQQNRRVDVSTGDAVPGSARIAG